MKQITIILKCPDNYVNSIREHVIDADRTRYFQYEILGIDVKEIEE